MFSVDTKQSVSLESMSEIESFDFTKEIGFIAADVFEAYPNKMYTPEDFAEQNIKNVSSVDKKGDNLNKMCTYRLLIHLPVGQVLSVYENSTSNSQKIWIDGKLVIQSGSASNSKNEEEIQNPRCNFASFYVENEVTEIVVQRDDITTMPKESFAGLYIGTSDMLSRLINLMFFLTHFL